MIDLSQPPHVVAQQIAALEAMVDAGEEPTLIPIDLTPDQWQAAKDQIITVLETALAAVQQQSRSGQGHSS